MNNSILLLFFKHTFFSDYFTSNWSNLILPLQQKISIGKFLRAENNICPQRNHFLGENFCRFAVNLKVFTDASRNNEQDDTNLLHNKHNEMIGNLDLSKSQSDDFSHISLPSTGRLLSGSINKCLNEWKQNATDQVRVSLITITYVLAFNILIWCIFRTYTILILLMIWSRKQ